MRRIALLALLAALSGCAGQESQSFDRAYYGTLEPFASDAVYFVITDRFVDGDSRNNYPDQGGRWRTFDRPIEHPDGGSANIGYLGGDFQGILNNAEYIADMGFTALWITPIVENPDEAFSGGFGLNESQFADRGKTGYHGYWGVNFFEVDEHLESPGLTFAEFNRRLEADYGLQTVLDIVSNHGSPSFTMPEDQPMFGEIYDRGGKLVADHQNLPPAELDPSNPLHAFFHREPDIAQASNLDDTNPDVLRYFVDAYLHWVEQGADAFRIDTIRHMPHAYWKQFSDQVRSVHPGFFMFGESFDYRAEAIAQHTYVENGGISVLDFPGKERISEVFSDVDGDYRRIVDYLHLTDGVYENPYDLMIFYDNHDMPRLDASETGFIDANNWLFTSRGIPVVYYGSEIAFRAGLAEHKGNRDYFGQENIDAAWTHPIRQSLSAIARVRRGSPALQRGLQANYRFTQHTAVFFRVFQNDGVAQTALVALNKADQVATLAVDDWLSLGVWRDALTGERFAVSQDRSELRFAVPAHGVRVLLFDGPNTNLSLASVLDNLHRGAGARGELRAVNGAAR